MTCKGTKSGTAQMMIQINITGERNLVLNLRRLKTCRKGIYHFLLNKGKSQETCYAFFYSLQLFYSYNSSQQTTIHTLPLPPPSKNACTACVGKQGDIYK